MLQEQQCTFCGKSALTSIEKKAARLANRSRWTTRLIATVLALGSVVFSDTREQAVICALAGALLVTLLWLFQRKNAAIDVHRHLDALIHREQSLIMNGLYRNWETSIASWEHDKQLTYEQLREIATLIRNDKIRLQQLALLHFFILRKDMDLQLDSLMINHYDPLLVDYISEVAKVKRELIKDATFRYTVSFEPEILGMTRGVDSLAAIAGAAVRSKHYVLAYPNFVRRYAHKLPKDRFLRLYRMMVQYPHEPWGGLFDEVHRIQREQYQWDADFQ
ncbi:hypothetical protein [Paenibacillus sp. 481]|uniref:hypothetical protein n=1 Tax=Paenibacillus sp. 481 TaxID=2835869 RepID=UPI001E38DAB6|nr:hypothetical protein [Paenibacillus sp. 481]